MIESICLLCGNSYHKQYSEQIYCSKKCVGIAKRTGEEKKCKYCEKYFYLRGAFVKRNTSFCSRECFLKYSDNLKIRNCEVCGKIFKTTYAKSKTKTCSKECKNILCTEKIEKKCEICQNIFLVTKATSDSKYCSVKCKSISHKTLFLGDKNPNWKNGVAYLPYPAGWNKFLKNEIKKRDNYKCQNCGTEKMLSVHHIDYNKNNLDLNNLITLCVSCNGKANAKREYWIQKYQSILEVVYG